MSNNEHCFTEDWYLSSLLNHHINGMVERYSCLLALRMDFFYQKNTDSFTSLNHSKLECDIRSLMLEIERDKKTIGYFWVIEWTERHGYHAHVVFWLDRQKTQTTFPSAEWITKCWQEITREEGGIYRCQHQERYKWDINIPVRYSEPESIENIRHVLSYLTKEEQKDGLFAYGSNEIPPRPASGRPRKH